MSIKYVTDLEVVNNEENITGEENILMVQDNQTKLVPMSLIKGAKEEDEEESAGSGMLIVDMNEYTSGTCNDKAIGDAVKEAVQTGVPFCIYMLDQYFFPIYCKINSTTTAGNVWVHELRIQCGNNMTFYFSVSDKF